MKHVPLLSLQTNLDKMKAELSQLPPEVRRLRKNSTSGLSGARYLEWLGVSRQKRGLLKVDEGGPGVGIIGVAERS